MEENSVLKHQLEEWKYLNDYVNKMDAGYQQIFVLMISIFTGALLVLTKNLNSELAKGIFIIPLGIIGMMAYLSYQFRITAILRGHLAALEEKMNKRLEEKVHMWNSALVETFMAHNNLINKNMMLPMFVFIIFLTGYCMWATWKILEFMNFDYYRVVFALYWSISIVLSLIVIIPFFENEKIRYETYNEDKVWEKYNKYLEKHRNIYNLSEFYYEDIDDLFLNDKNCRSVAAFWTIMVFVFGFGVLNIFWYFSDKSLGVKGLYDYYAATIGDGLCLPLLVGAGKYYICQYTQKGRRKRLYGKTALIFAGIGMMIQVYWLLNPKIELNWTIDRAHHFNIAGWYHALFFVAMFYIVARIIMSALWVRSKTKNMTRKSLDISYILMWFAGIGFWVTHLIDDYLKWNNYPAYIIASGIVLLLFFILCEIYFESDKTSKIIFSVGIIGLHMMLYFFCKVGGLEWNVIELIEKINAAIR